MATKIGLLNNALIALGQDTLTDTGEAIEAGRVLNEVYDEVVADILADGDWNFAIETIKAAADTGVTPNFGFTEVFAKPSDWVKTTAVSADENFSWPLLRFYDDANFWSADETPLYFRYVSNDTGLGLELSRWPAQFRRYVELELALRVVFKLTNDKDLLQIIEKRRDKARIAALNVDAMNEPQPKFFPMGSWNRARGGRAGRGSRAETDKVQT